MGFFSSIKDVLDPGSAVIGKVFGSKAGDLVSKFADPLDLFGTQAGKAADEINNLLEQSAAAGIALNEQQLARIEELTAPFTSAATGTALPNLSALALGGDVDFQQSQLATNQLGQGREGIIGGQAAGSNIKSSDTFSRLSDLASGVAAEDVGRFERGNTALLDIGRGAEQGFSQAGSQLTGNIGALLSNLGAGKSATSQNLQQQKIASGQTVASGLAGLSQLLAG